MRQIFLLVTCVVILNLANTLPRGVTSLPKYTKLNDNQVRHLQNRGFGQTASSPFSVTSAYEEDDYGHEEDNEGDSSVSSTQVRRPTYAEENYPVPFQNAIPIQQARPQPRPQQQQQQLLNRRPPGPPQQYKQQLVDESRGKTKHEEEEEEKEEPDRLSLLLPQSKFDCGGKNTGYYADEDLGCEVFHYCQDNGKHSWICPEGFTFHQVHLICMPPGADNICEKSSQFHFINDYLYKPVNLEEHQNKPNISLRYSERYYPEQYYNRYDDEEVQQSQRKQPIRVGLQQAPAPQAPVLQTLRRQQPLPFSPTFRPETTVGQVFRSPEEVNISLQQRRPPQQYITPRYQRQDDDY